MGIRKATTAFLTTPSLGRTFAVATTAGAGAAALAHLINMPKEDQAAVVAEAEDQGLSPLELIVGALVAGGVGDQVHHMENEAEEKLQQHADSPESKMMIEELKKAESDKDVMRKYERMNNLGRRLM